MISHSHIKKNIAEAICRNSAVRDYCVSTFGKGALVIVDWYGSEGTPSVKESPFIFIYSADENEAGFVDEETFTVHVVVGGKDTSSTPTRQMLHERSATQNGLVINGISERLEHLRYLVENIVRTADSFGAVPRTFTREESSTADWPLEWAKLNIEFFEPETI